MVGTAVRVPERTQSTIGPGLTIIVPLCGTCSRTQHLITLEETSGLLVDFAAFTSANDAGHSLLERKRQFEAAGSAAQLMPGGPYLNQMGSSSSRTPGSSASEDAGRVCS